MKQTTRKLTKEEIKKSEDLAIKMIEKSWKEISQTMAIYQMCIFICGCISCIITCIIINDFYKSIIPVIFVIFTTVFAMIAYGFTTLNGIIKECTINSIKEVTKDN